MADYDVPNTTNLPTIWNSSNWIASSLGATGYTGSAGSAGATGATGTGYQFTNSVFLATDAGGTDQGTYGIAIGFQAAQYNQSTNGIAIGRYAAGSTQGDYGIAIGTGTARTNQGLNSIAIGRDAGTFDQGAGCIAIGAYAGGGVTAQAEGSILLYSGDSYFSPGTTGFFVSPIRGFQGSTYTIGYNLDTYEITYENWYKTQLFGITWNTVTPPLDTPVSMCMSQNGQYVYIFDSNYCFVSTDYGQSFNVTTTVPGITNASCSWDGKYVLTGNSLSSDYGQSFSTISPILNAGAISGTGQYMFGCGYNDGNIYSSSDYGVTWNTVTTGTAIFGPGSCDISYDGKVSFLSNETNNYMYYSIDYCTTYSNLTLPVATRSVTVSANGQYVTYIGLDSNAYTSSNYGLDFTTATTAITTNLSEAYMCQMDSTGQYQVVGGVGTNGGLSISTDFGRTFGNWLYTPTSDMTIPWNCWISANGQYIGYCQGTHYYYCKNTFI